MIVRLNSFSFIKGLPQQDVNGGGYIFDVRCIDNPGRIEEYKFLSGEDKEVIEYFEKTDMNEYLKSVQSILKLTLERYRWLRYQNLVVSFGCTGGQHRSVYACNRMAEFIRDFDSAIEIRICHTNKDNWLTKERA